jgi:hypothetical protein
MNAVILKLHEQQLHEVFAWLAVHVPHDDAQCDNYRWSWSKSMPFDVPHQDYMFYFREQQDALLFEQQWKSA